VRNHRGSHLVVASEDPSDLVPLDEVERRYILRVLQAVGGNKTLAARTLGLDRKTLYRKLER
jgi:two-component system response regulator HydG